MMEIMQLVIGIGLVGMLWRIATELGSLRTSVDYITERIGKIEDRVGVLEETDDA